MEDKRKIRFGSGYKSNYNIPPEENWKNMREYYLQKDGRDIGDYPVYTEEERKEIEKELEFLFK